MPDRHQAVEAKEGVSITVAAEHAAQITFQSYFRLYKKLAGMSGTAVWMMGLVAVRRREETGRRL